MAPKVNVYVATSLDGFLARRDGGIDWLEAARSRMPAGEDCGLSRFASAMEVIVLGRRTFEKVIGFKAWPYGKKRVYVLSSRPIVFPRYIPSSVAHSKECPSHLLARLECEGVRQVWVDGGITIQRFLAAGLVDDIIVNRFPVLLGEGKPLFGAIPRDVPLSLIASKSYDFGLVQSHYRVHKKRSKKTDTREKDDA